MKLLAMEFLTYNAILVAIIIGVSLPLLFLIVGLLQLWRPSSNLKNKNQQEKTLPLPPGRFGFYMLEIVFNFICGLLACHSKGIIGKAESCIRGYNYPYLAKCQSLYLVLSLIIYICGDVTILYTASGLLLIPMEHMFYGGKKTLSSMNKGIVLQQMRSK